MASSRSLIFSSTLILALVSGCGGKQDAKPNPTQSSPRAMDGGAAGAAEPGPDKPSDARVAASRAVKSDAFHKANPQLGMKPPPAPSAPKKIDFNDETRRDVVDTLGYTVPQQWDTQTPNNKMRLAQYDVPGEGGGASLVLYRFPGGGGTAQQNIDRWVTQFEGEGGKPVSETMKVAKTTQAGFELTTVDMAGTYSPPAMAPGAPRAAPMPNTRMLAAIVEGDGNPYFLKLLGPKATVDAWAPQFDAMVASIDKGQ